MRTELDIIAEKNYARETGFAEGRAEGEAAKAESIARKLLAMGLTMEQTAEVTGLQEKKLKVCSNISLSSD